MRSANLIGSRARNRSGNDSLYPMVRSRWASMEVTFERRGSGRPIPPLVSEIQGPNHKRRNKTARRLDPRLFGALFPSRKIPCSRTFGLSLTAPPLLFDRGSFWAATFSPHHLAASGHVPNGPESLAGFLVQTPSDQDLRHSQFHMIESGVGPLVIDLCPLT